VPRPLRIIVSRVSVHVFQRGHNRADVFADSTDKAWFLAFLEAAAGAQGLDVHAYALMSNHYHLLGTPSDEGALSRTMHQCNSRFGRYYNARHSRTGTLWGGRFRSVVMREERQWLTCLRYVEQNPVRAHIVDAAEDYQWSSYRVHAFGAPPDWLVPHPVYVGLGPTPSDRQAAYKQLCGELVDEHELVVQRLGESSGARHVPGTCLAPMGGRARRPG